MAAIAGGFRGDFANPVVFHCLRSYFAVMPAIGSLLGIR
jgi:hypothetical protein